MSSLCATVGPPFNCHRSPSNNACRSTAVFHASRIAREGQRLAQIREPKFALNLPAVIKQTPPSRLAPVLRAAVVAHWARLVHRYGRKLRGVVFSLGRRHSTALLP